VTEHADVVVIGLGPGGEDVAGRLADAGLDVVGIDANLVGGECPYWGCVPSKMMIRAANALAEGRRIVGLAGAADIRPDWAPVAQRIRSEATDDWDDTAAVERFVGRGGRFVRGAARLDGPGRVLVGDRVFEAARAVVVATGAQAWIPPIAGLADTPYWTNRDVVETEHLPSSVAIIGGGAIGVELAQVFRRFGVSVTVLDVAPALVGPEEPEAGALLARVFASEGIELRLGAEIESVRHADGRFEITAAGDAVVAERLLVAAGRRVDLAALGVSSIDVDETAAALPVDGHLRVIGADGVWAVGDVTGKGAFTHVSMYQADIVVKDLLGGDVVPADYRALPRVTFTDPEIGAVGMTERAALEQGLTISVGSAPVPESARGWIHKVGNEGFVKIVADRDRDVIIGATSMGPAGGEVLGLLTVAVHAEVPIDRLRHMIYAYPTFHRAIETAIADLHPVDGTAAGEG